VTAYLTPLVALEAPAECEFVASSAISRESARERDEAFVWFVQEIETDLIRTTRRLAPDGVDPRDLAAEALARSYAQWDRIGTMEWRRAWVFRVVGNLALTARSSGRRGALSLRRWAPMMATDGSGTPAVCSAEAAAPSTRRHHASLHRRLDREGHGARHEHQPRNRQDAHRKGPYDAPRRSWAQP
jgi:DNA-directed RNA polymerase specialized sigma24 family protein